MEKRCSVCTLALEFNAVVRLYLKVVTLKRVTCIYIWLKAASLIVRGAASGAAIKSVRLKRRPCAQEARPVNRKQVRRRKDY